MHEFSIQEDLKKSLKKALKKDKVLYDSVMKKMQEIITELNYQVNQRLNKFSRIQQFVIQPVPFQKTPTKKIKRYLYY